MRANAVQAGLACGVMLSGSVRDANGQSVIEVPAAVSQLSGVLLHISGDGSTVFGERVVGSAGGQWMTRPWRWSAGAGVQEPALPAGMATGFWSSWTAAGDRGIVDARTADGAGRVFAQVDAAGVSGPLTFAVPGYVAARISGDGRTILAWEDSGAASPSAFALSGPAGVRIVSSSAAGWSTLPFGLSYDGMSVGGLSAPAGGIAVGRMHLMRWSDGPTAGGPDPANAVPDGLTMGVYAGLSGDGWTNYGGAFDENFVLRPFLCNPATGFETIETPGIEGFVRAVSFDARTALIEDSMTQRSMLWERGVGAVPIEQFLAQRGVDLAGFSGLAVTDLSYDARTFVGTAWRDGVQVPVVITVPGPGAMWVVVSGGVLACVRRRR